LLEDLSVQRPDLVVVSGDLTQRARKAQFAAAKSFLDRIAAPQVVVPGNHDLPLFDVLRRLMSPLGRYCRFITPDLSPMFYDAELAVIGVNTSRPGTWKDGRISVAQVAYIEARFQSIAHDRFKVLVAHHPFIPPKDDPEAALVGRAHLALRMLENCGCALILAGHLHQAYSGDARLYHVEIKRSILVAQAGTAISHRRRDEPNAYNDIVLDGQRLSLDVRAWDGKRFALARSSEFRLSENGWVALQ
jgi:3',5'-cyclic AMP phosphodiesterase CpdA